MDAAFKTPENEAGSLQKLYSNGALYKYADKADSNSNKIYVYSNDKSYDSQYVKYKDLGEKQYNYDKKSYEAYYGLKSSSTAVCKGSLSLSCDYYSIENPQIDNKNKYLYDRWCLSLVFAIFIAISNI